MESHRVRNTTIMLPTSADTPWPIETAARQGHLEQSLQLFVSRYQTITNAYNVHRDKRKQQDELKRLYHALNLCIQQKVELGQTHVHYKVGLALIEIKAFKKALQAFKSVPKDSKYQGLNYFYLSQLQQARLYIMHKDLFSHQRAQQLQLASDCLANVEPSSEEKSYLYDLLAKRQIARQRWRRAYIWAKVYNAICDIQQSVDAVKKYHDDLDSELEFPVSHPPTPLTQNQNTREKRPSKCICM